MLVDRLTSSNVLGSCGALQGRRRSSPRVSYALSAPYPTGLDSSRRSLVRFPWLGPAVLASVLLMYFWERAVPWLFLPLHLAHFHFAVRTRHSDSLIGLPCLQLTRASRPHDTSNSVPIFDPKSTICGLHQAAKGSTVNLESLRQSLARNTRVLPVTALSPLDLPAHPLRWLTVSRVDEKSCGADRRPTSRRALYLAWPPFASPQ